MDKHYAVALVYAWLVENPEYYSSWVRPHLAVRYSPREEKLMSTTVGGHWRRLAGWGGTLPSLGCVCNFERLAKPAIIGAPPQVQRRRYDENGDFIPRVYRYLIWS